MNFSYATGSVLDTEYKSKEKLYLSNFCKRLLCVNIVYNW